MSLGRTARVGAAVLALALSLAGPQAIGTAAADTGDSGSADQAAKAGAHRADAGARRSPQAADTGRAAARKSSRPQPAPAHRSARRQRADSAVTPAVATPTDSGSAPTAIAEPKPAPTVLSSSEPAVTRMPSTPVAPARATAAALAVAAVPAGSATATGDIFSSIFGPIQAFIEGIGLLVRRTFFNQPPTVDPMQTTGQLTGPITGTLNAVDPEGDPLSFDVVVSPQYGSVVVDALGDFVYTPGPDFTGRDSFNVAVTDEGFHFNLLDPFRPASTEAYMPVTQNAVQAMLSFAFAYGSGSQYWTAEARRALEASAERLAAYLVVTTPITITYAVTATSDPQSSTLASAGSDLTGGGTGFFPTVVQEKILTGIDPNGKTADGDIDFNFGNPWAFGSSVSSSQYDFTSTAMHELMHSLGFLSYTYAAGNNTDRNWTTFDGFMVTSNGTKVINPSTFRWNTVYDPNLTGRNGGLYFGGPNAIAAYGGYVPLFTPNPWEEGSSTSHLDDDTFTGSNAQLMNAYSEAGLGVRVLSPVELGILKDLGYTVTDTPVWAFVVLGFGFLRRRPRRD